MPFAELLRHRYSYDNTPNDSVGSQNCTWEGTPTYSSSFFQEGTHSAGKFTQTNAMRIPQAAHNYQYLAFEFHLRIDNLNNPQSTTAISFHHTGGNWGYVQVDASGILGWNVDGNQITWSTPLSEDTWYEIKCVVDDTTQYIYVDGDLKNSGASNGSDMSNVDQAGYVGKYGALGNFDVDGYIDDLRVYELVPQKDFTVGATLKGAVVKTFTVGATVGNVFPAVDLTAVVKDTALTATTKDTTHTARTKPTSYTATSTRDTVDT